jgi:low temperature requirement protein LtrA
LIELCTPFFVPRLTRAIPVDRSHLPERFGLFTIIVLGESLIATAMGASMVQWNAITIATASMGFAMAACIWWINFEFVEDDAIKSRSLTPRVVYLYSHFFIVSSIVAIGIGVEHAIKDTADAHLHLPTLALLGGGIAIYLSAGHDRQTRGRCVPAPIRSDSHSRVLSCDDIYRSVRSAFRFGRRIFCDPCFGCLA